MQKFTLIAGAALIAVGSTAVIATAKGGPRGVEQLFERLDADGNGEITQAEMQAAAEARFAAADSNGDGLLSAEEMAAEADARRADRIAKRVERLDTDGDGQLSLAEVTAAREGRHGKMFERIDANGDGVITQAEAEEARKYRRGKHKRGDHTQRN